MAEDKKLKIAHFTDPLCFWCYAMEPEMRKLRVMLGDKLDYRIVMGVLSYSTSDYAGTDELSDMRYEFIRIELAEKLGEAAKRVGMPFSLECLQNGDPEELVSLPLSRAYCAMKMVDEDCAEPYLRRMRECVYAEGRGLGSTDKLVELAREFPIDAEAFRSILENNEADEELQKGIAECHAHFIGAFPTLLVQYGDSGIVVSGYHGYDELRWAISQLTQGRLVPGDAEYSLEALEAYMQRFGKAAAREIQVMFSLDDAQLDDAIMDLVATGRYTTMRCESSFFVVPK